MTICPEQTFLRMFCCFSSGDDSGDGRKTLKVVARNIYKELNVEDLRAEYLRTKSEIQDYELLKVKHPDDHEAVQIYLEKLKIKLGVIKDLFKSKGKQEGLTQDGDTLAFVDAVFNAKKHEASHRMRGLYTYDIKKNPDYEESQRTETKVTEYFKQKKETEKQEKKEKTNKKIKEYHKKV